MKIKDKSIETLIYTDRLAGVFSEFPPTDILIRNNENFLEVKIPENIKKYFPWAEKFVIYNKDNIDLSKRLQKVVVYASIKDKPTTEEIDEKTGYTYDESNVVVVWFQDYEDNLYTKAEEVISSLDWQKEAVNYSW